MTDENEAGQPEKNRRGRRSHLPDLIDAHRDPAHHRHGRNKEARREELMEAATAVFAEHGFDAATTREIARRAGCSEGLIHRYFDGKRGLLEAVIHGKIEWLSKEFDSMLPSCETVEAEIERILLLHLSVMWEGRDFMRVSISQAVVNPSMGSEMGDAVTIHCVSLIKERLRAHQKAGRVRTDVDLEAVAETIAWLGFSLGFFAQSIVGLDRDHVRYVAGQAAAAISHGVEAPGSRKN